MGYSVEEIGEVVWTANRAAHIAGRCSVFAKTDMIHAQQKGYTPAEILRGFAMPWRAISRASIVKGRPVTPPVPLLGRFRNFGRDGGAAARFSVCPKSS